VKQGEDLYHAFVEKVTISEPPDGPLNGTLFGVKDNVAVEGQLFTAGHPLFKDRRATVTAPAVQTLLSAGATLIGMTETDAGGFGASTPQTINPSYPTQIVGGSSGGSAAVVAAGYCDFAIGTDTGGSLRIPSACTGLTALKPTFGRVPNDGVWPLTPQLDHVGLIAQNLKILSLAGTALLKPSMKEGFVQPEHPLRIAVETNTAEFFDKGIALELDEIHSTLGSCGHTVERISIPGRENIAEAHGVIVLSEAASIYSDLTENEKNQLGKAAKSALRHSENLTPDMLEAAWEWARAVTAKLDATLSKFDVLISPTLPVSPPGKDARRIVLAGEEVPVVVAMTFLTCLANITGNPVVSLPNPGSTLAPKTSFQLTGKRGSDEWLLDISIKLENDLRNEQTAR